MLNTHEQAEILLVEDNEDDEELTLRALAKLNPNKVVWVARDGAEALDYLFAAGSHAGQSVERKLRLILLDLKLPKVSGLEVLRRIKGDERTKNIPVVVLTSSREQPDVIESYELRANGYIVKPVDSDNFTKAVSDLGLYWLALNEPPL